MTQEQFRIHLYEQKGLFGETIDFKNQDIIFPHTFEGYFEFNTTIFICRKLIFKNIRKNDIELRFLACDFQCEIIIDNSSINRLWFEDTLNIEALNIFEHSNKDYNSEIKDFNFSYDIRNKEIPDLNTNFNLKGVKFNIFQFKNVKIENGSFLFKNNIIDDAEKTGIESSFKNSTLYNTNFESNIFNSKVDFSKCIFSHDINNPKKEGSFFTSNIFNDVDFIECNFKNTFYLYKCIFQKTARFYNIRNLENSKFNIIESEFVNYANFNRSEINNFLIDKTEFKHTVSFQQTTFNHIKINRTIFEKLALFDEIKISIIAKCDRRTIRNIKQQLQKAENKIDYNRFRSYELQAYYKELNWKWNEGFKDKVILGATLLSTGFEHSWRRALAFTLGFGFLWYSILYRIEHKGSFDYGKIESFWNGYYRFLLVTDFYNPFVNDKRSYLENGWSGLVMIIGKIFIAFGIYEMIQAFRKFKA